MSSFSWVASSILAQRNIEMHYMIQREDRSENTIVFTIYATDGTIGIITIPSILAAASYADARKVLEPLFQTVEFKPNGQSAVPEVQPTIPEPDSGVSETLTETVPEAGSGSETTDSTGSPEPETESQGTEPEPGPEPVEPDRSSDESSVEPEPGVSDDTRAVEPVDQPTDGQ